ncbi:MAG: SGNH/GDSL hydrolase family protein [Verrucomicrobiota bacterium]
MKSVLGALFVMSATLMSAGAVVIWPIGDSLTSGFTRAGAYRPQLYTALTRSGVPVDFVGSATNDSTAALTTVGQTNHDGHSGWFISDTAAGTADNGKGIYESVQGWHAGVTPPGVILLMIGTNDLNGNNSVSTAPARFELLLARLETLSPTARIIVGSVPKASETNTYKNAAVTALNTSINTYNSSIRGIVSTHAANGKKVEFLDVNAAMALTDLGSDGLHFSQAGYDKLGNLWAGAVLAPEPGSAVLLAAGGLIALCRRKRH